MLLAVRRRIAKVYIVARLFCARVMHATLVADVDHSILCMALAVYWWVLALHIEVRPGHAGFIRTTLVTDVHHAALGMPFAVRPRADPLDVKSRHSFATIFLATHHSYHGGGSTKNSR